MNKIFYLLLVATIIGCSEQDNFKTAVREQMQSEKDLKDYGLDVEVMTECVVDMSSKAMPGVVAFDPIRKKTYENYAKMLGMQKTQDPKKTLEELRQEFGSAKGLADAHFNYTNAYMECMSGLVTQHEQSKADAEAEKNKTN